MIHCYIQMTMRFTTTFTHQHFCKTLKYFQLQYSNSDGPFDIFTQDLPHHGNVQKNSAHDNQENCHRCIHHMVFQGIYHDIA